jgi:hypothetical protein
MPRSVTSACLAALLMCVPATAMADPEVTPAVDKAAKEKKICKSDVSTGSIMPKRTCRTKAEWDAITAQSQADLDRTRAMDRSKAMVAGSR